MEQTQKNKIKCHPNWRRYLPIFIFPLGLLWMEMVIKIWDFGNIWNLGLLYTTLFTLSAGLLCSFLTTLGGQWVNRIASLAVMGFLTFLYMVQAVYFTVMRTVFAVYSVSVATGATEYWKVGLHGVWRTLPILLLLAVPFVLLCVFGKGVTPEKGSFRRKLGLLGLSVFFYGVAIAAIILPNGGILDPWGVYRQEGSPELTISKFGVLTSLRLDLGRLLFPPAEAPEEPPATRPDLSQEHGGYEPNVMDISFQGPGTQEGNEEIAALDTYFSTREPSYQNQYTGLFQGKNLIMITAEAFSPWAVDETLTPTLYRLSHEGFVFENFYTPLWWVSTSDGEYVSCTSLLPKSGEQSMGASSHNSLYFCMGNRLRAQGYETRAYHDHTYSYYGRDLSHPNMGYLYKGVGKGLELEALWPESDREMMEKTFPEYGTNAPFHVYYMTVSGHLQYNFEQNAMSARHQEAVSHLNLSEEARAYLACQIELDKAVEQLLTDLEAAGQLENTVIALYPDHYPYGLTEGAIEELAGPGVKDSADLYRSTFILWSGDKREPIPIQKPCSNLDILPTLLNLFGLEYDSRLLMGRDILSDDPGLVIFSDCSYITDLGGYDAQEDEFTPVPDAVVPQDYAQEMLQIVRDKFQYAGKMLETDYYRTLRLIPAGNPS